MKYFNRIATTLIRYEGNWLNIWESQVANCLSYLNNTLLAYEVNSKRIIVFAEPRCGKCLTNRKSYCGWFLCCVCDQVVNFYCCIILIVINLFLQLYYFSIVITLYYNFVNKNEILLWCYFNFREHLSECEIMPRTSFCILQHWFFSILWFLFL